MAKTHEELLAIEPLSKCLQKASCAAEASGPQELRDWLRLELAGYYSSNKALTEGTVVPEYRTVVGQPAPTLFMTAGRSLLTHTSSPLRSVPSPRSSTRLAGKYKLTPEEMAGFKLFNGKGNCNSCHLDGRGTSLKSNQTDTNAAAMVNPLFTCFGSANEGLPLNPRDSFYYQTKPDAYGFRANPYGFGYRDLGAVAPCAIPADASATGSGLRQ